MRSLGNCLQTVLVPSGDAICPYQLIDLRTSAREMAEGEMGVKAARQTYQIEEDDALLLDAVRQEHLDGLDARAARSCLVSCTRRGADRQSIAAQNAPSMGSSRST